MALGILKPSTPSPGVLGRKDPRHFVVLGEGGRIDASLTSNVKLADALEKRAGVPVTNAKQGPADGSRPVAPAPNIKTVDPYDVTIAMAATDGEPLVSQTDKETWTKFRISYDVVLDAPPFRITGSLLLLPSVDPSSLAERGTDLFLPVFNPLVQTGATPIRDVPRDSILVNRSHIRRVNATLRR